MLEKLRRKAKGKRKLGFTLVEVTISIVISSIIGLATFAIISSALDTFNRQQEVVDAIDVKEMVLLYTRDQLRTCSDMRLREFWNQDHEGNILYNNDGRTMLSGDNAAEPDIDNAPEIDKTGGPHIIDKKIKECHMIFSENGRIYRLNSNIYGRVDYSDQPSEYPMPMTTTDLKSPYAKAFPLFDEAIYGNYDVELKFKPIYTAQQGKYRDIQLIINVTKKNSTEVIVTGTETFHLLNVENSKKEINFKNFDQEVVVDAPVFSYCYFA